MSVMYYVRYSSRNDDDDDDDDDVKMLSIWQINEVSKFYLYDAVYLYLRTVNRTLAGYLDYRDGRLIFRKTIGQRFAGRRRPG